MVNDKYELDDYEKKIFKHMIKPIGNGFFRIIILWELYKEPLHGYGLIKKLSLFYKKQLDEGLIKKVNSSKLYPMLQKMEDLELIEGYWIIQNNKNVKYYKITKKGVEFLNKSNSRVHEVSLNPMWKEFINEMILKETNFTYKEEN